MADPQNPSAPPPDADTLDLRQLASQDQWVLTSVGHLRLRRITSLGPLDRVRVGTIQQEALRAAQRLAEADPGALEATDLESMASTVVMQEDRLLGLILPDATPEQLAALPAHERAGVMRAFFGGTAAQVRQAVKATVDVLEQRGARRSRGSKGSTVATPSGG